MIYVKSRLIGDGSRGVSYTRRPERLPNTNTTVVIRVFNSGEIVAVRLGLPGDRGFPPGKSWKISNIVLSVGSRESYNYRVVFSRGLRTCIVDPLFSSGNYSCWTIPDIRRFSCLTKNTSYLKHSDLSVIPCHTIYSVIRLSFHFRKTTTE